jgi:hypothetical protein
MGLRTLGSIESLVQTLRDAADIFLARAREELEAGLSEGDWIKIRQAAEKAWNAVVQSTDFAMAAHGRTPLPGRDSHRDRRLFLEEIAQPNLARDYAYFSERLHGDLYYAGEKAAPEMLRRYLDEVEEYVRKVSAA